MFDSMKIRSRRNHCLDIFNAAVSAVLPANFLPAHLPAPPEMGRLFILAAGKAAGSMAAAAEAHYLDVLGFPSERMVGLAVARHGYGVPMRVVEMIESGHPVPDEASVEGARRMMALADLAGANDLVVFLLSGGASANLVAPAGNITLAEKQAFTKTLLRSGVPIDGMNAIRKHLSRIKGGRLARHVAPARLVTLALSDVPNDDFSTIGSGPTIPDVTTLADARGVIARYGIAVPPAITAALDDPGNESVKPGDPAFDKATAIIAARPADAFSMAVAAAEKLGYRVINLGSELEGEARAIGAQHAAATLRTMEEGGKIALISGGELTVTIKGDGIGGPNQEYALALAIGLNGANGIVACAADTDGTDGGAGKPTDPAGAFVDPTTLKRATEHGLDPARFLENNDSTRFFAALDDLHQTGPTLTNANDLRVILIGD
ncbi:MAG TPA: glycerate kinase [Rhabdaerophilum sp.]|nr:glycerate kinase [Rhabdaerophilum sp.]